MIVADSGNGLVSPRSMSASANGDVFIADTGNNRVIEIPWNSSTHAYGSQVVLVANLGNPSGVAVGANKNLYIADTGNNASLKSRGWPAPRPMVPNDRRS